MILQRAPLAVFAIVLINLLLHAAYAATIDVGPESRLSRIQDAIDAATPGDTINVANGTYLESINITKQLTLKGSGNTVVDASGQGSAIVISANSTTVENIHAANSPETGIKVISSGNVLRDNEVSGNSLGMDIISSNHNTLRNNLIYNNQANFEVISLKDIDNYNDIDTSNLVDGRPIYYLNNASDVPLDSSSKAGTVYCLSCKNISIKNQNFTNNTMSIVLFNTTNSIIENNQMDNNKGGVFLQNSFNNTILGNNISNSDHVGIFISSSQNNTISGNNVSEGNYGIVIMGSSQNIIQNNTIDGNSHGIRIQFSSIRNSITQNSVKNGQYGIFIQASRSNTIYFNDFINNVHNAFSQGSADIWNSSKPIPYKYADNRTIGYPGNFWSDYSGKDKENDGIGDTPYAIGPDKDNEPLMEQFEKYIILKGERDQP